MTCEVETLEFKGMLIEILVHDSNPAEKILDQLLYREGYIEIIISSNGTNPYYKPMVQRILLVVPKEQYVNRSLSDENLYVIPILPSTHVEKIIPSYGKVEQNGEIINCSMITIHLVIDADTKCQYSFFWSIVDIKDFFPLP